MLSRREEMIQHAMRLGATGASVIDPADVAIKDEFAAMCTPTACENHGLSPYCPPHVAGPPRMRALLESSTDALVAKLEAPTSEMVSGDPRPVMAKLQRLVADIDARARVLGFERCRGFAGGSCKRLFCHEKPGCPVLDGTGRCRYPDRARPSMSGFGVDVARLMQSAGWSFEKIDSHTDVVEQPTSSVVGLVLLRRPG